MKVSQLVPVENICIGWPDKQDVRQRNKWNLIETGILFLGRLSRLSSEVILSSIQATEAREKSKTTAIGHGVAIPHASVSMLSQPVGAFFVLSEGIDFEAIDHEPVSLVFLTLLPDKQLSRHVHILSNIVNLTHNPDFREKLRVATTPEKAWNLICHFEV